MIISQDSLQRANQSGFGPSSDGETWTTLDAGTLSIAGNEGVIVSVGADTHVQLGSRTAADMEVLCRIAISDVGDICGIQGRFTAASGTTCYKLLWYAGNIHLNKANAGTNAQLTAVPFTMTPGTFYGFRLRIVGVNLFGKIWQNGTAEPGGWTTTTTDNTVTGVGGFALLANTVGSGVQFDHFTAMTIVNIVRPQHRSFARIV